MTDLISLPYVKRVLGDEGSAHDARIADCIDAVTSWARRKLWIPVDGEGTSKYYDISEDASLQVPRDVEITEVRFYPYIDDPNSDTFLTTVVNGSYEHDAERGRLYLRPVLTVQPFEGARASRSLRQYARVEIDYDGGSAFVPADLTEGLAFLTAGYYFDGPRALSGLTQEKMGDYSYTLDKSGGDKDESFVQRARFFLGDYFKRAKVEAT